MARRAASKAIALFIFPISRPKPWLYQNLHALISFDAFIDDMGIFVPLWE